MLENTLSEISDACHIELNNDMPGIQGLFAYDPSSAIVYTQLMEHLLKEDHDLPIEFRELLVAYVSKANNCNFCFNLHKQVALATTENSQELIREVLTGNYKNLTPKFYYLLQIAKTLSLDSQGVTGQLIKTAREFECTDEEIHRTIQIAAFTSMYNRYVDGMKTIPGNLDFYRETAQAIYENGYSAKQIMG